MIQPSYDDPVCIGCPYRLSNRPGLAPSSGRAHSPIASEFNNAETLLVATAPGIDEWNEGRPLVSEKRGSAGKRIADSISRVGRARTDFDITEVVMCFPGKKNSVDGKPPRDKAPLEKAKDRCQKWLQKTIQLGNYSKIVTIGAVAKKYVDACNKGQAEVINIAHPASWKLTNLELDAALRHDGRGSSQIG